MSARVTLPLPPRNQGVARDGPATLVANTTFCRRPGFWVNQFPSILSVAP